MVDPRIFGWKHLDLEAELASNDSVRDFCQKFEVKLLRAFLTNDPDEPGPIYQFTDELGGYNIEGIKRSLEEGDYKCMIQ